MLCLPETLVRQNDQATRRPLSVVYKPLDIISGYRRTTSNTGFIFVYRSLPRLNKPFYCWLGDYDTLWLFLDMKLKR